MKFELPKSLILRAFPADETTKVAKHFECDLFDLLSNPPDIQHRAGTRLQHKAARFANAAATPDFAPVFIPKRAYYTR